MCHVCIVANLCVVSLLDIDAHYSPMSSVSLLARNVHRFFSFVIPKHNNIKIGCRQLLDNFDDLE